MAKRNSLLDPPKIQMNEDMFLEIEDRFQWFMALRRLGKKGRGMLEKPSYC